MLVGYVCCCISSEMKVYLACWCVVASSRKLNNCEFFVFDWFVVCVVMWDFVVGCGCVHFIAFIGWVEIK